MDGLFQGYLERSLGEHGLGIDMVKGSEDRDTIARQHSVRTGKPPSRLLREGGRALADAVMGALAGGPGETL